MTKKQYAEFQAAVERNLKGLERVSTGPCPGCDECGLGEEPTEEERELACEAHFSWQECDACGSRLGGDREPAHGIMKSGGREILVHLNICADCLYYLNYGQLDDTSMMEMEEEAAI